MAWLAELAAISGPRWSCGAYWAEDGNPQASDTDWGDASTWDAAHTYDPDAAVSLGVFVEGVDVTALTRSASWGLGLSDPLATSAQPSSCSLRLQEGAAAAVGARVCILTEWDVLWTGRADDVSERVDVERTELELSCTDDLARATLATVTDRALGGDAMGLMDTLLLAAGVVGRAYSATADDHDPPAYHPDPSQPVPNTWPNVLQSDRTGPILPMLSAIAYYLGWLSTFTPSGLRVAYQARHHDLEYPTPVRSLEDFRSLTRRTSIASVRNLVELTGWGVAPLTDTVEDADSQAAYGIRSLSIDGTGWYVAAIAASSPNEWAIDGFGGDALDYFDPVLMLDADAAIASRRHRIARLMPFDHVTVGDPDVAQTTERYRVLRVAHRLGPDAWSVGLEAVAVSSTAPPGIDPDSGLGRMALGEDGLGE